MKVSVQVLRKFFEKFGKVLNKGENFNEIRQKFESFLETFEVKVYKVLSKNWWNSSKFQEYLDITLEKILKIVLKYVVNFRANFRENF